MKRAYTLKHNLLKYVKRLLFLSLFLFGGITILGLLFPRYFLFDLFANFRLQFIWVLLACLVSFLFFRQKRWAFVCFLLATINFVDIWPVYWPATLPDDSEKAIKLLSINVFSHGKHYDRVAREIERRDPDMLVLVEINQRWEDSLSIVLERFPYRHTVIQEDSYGVGMYSKIPLTNNQIERFGEFQTPIAISSFFWKEQEIGLIGIHPRAPEGLNDFRMRNAQMQEMIENRAKYPELLIVVGDYNNTPYSPYFGDFQREMELTDSRNGFGIQASWPGRFFPLHIPLDHCLLSEDIRVRKREVGPYVGSDHLPLFLELVPVIAN